MRIFTDQCIVGDNELIRPRVSDSGTFMIFSFACFIGYFWSTYIVPETANVSLEEIDTVFGSSAGREDMEAKYQVRERDDRHVHFQTAAHNCLQIEEDLGLHALVAELTSGPANAQNME